MVGSARPFQSTLDAETKLVPLTVSVTPAAPAVTLAGASEDSVGTGLALVIVKADVFDVPPPGAGVLTATPALPAVLMLPDGTDAVSFVLLT